MAPSVGPAGSPRGGVVWGQCIHVYACVCNVSLCTCVHDTCACTTGYGSGILSGYRSLRRAPPCATPCGDTALAVLPTPQRCGSFPGSQAEETQAKEVTRLRADHLTFYLTAKSGFTTPLFLLQTPSRPRPGAWVSCGAHRGAAHCGRGVWGAPNAPWGWVWSWEGSLKCGGYGSGATSALSCVHCGESDIARWPAGGQEKEPKV